MGNHTTTLCHVGSGTSQVAVVPTAPRLRDRQRAATEAAILNAAWEMFAGRGPDAVPLRDVAASAGCTHGLVVRYFGSKAGLVAAVGDQLTTKVAGTVDLVQREADDPLRALLVAARECPSGTKLLVRSALGDLAPPAFPRCLEVASVLAATRHRPRPDGPRGARSRLLAYGASSLVLGWVTFEDFVVAATGLGSLGGARRDRAVAAIAGRLLALDDSPEPRLAPRDVPGGVAERIASDRPAGSRDALLGSAIELFADRGPASVSIREISRHAGVNHGLVHRHFGSKDDLLGEAIEKGSSIVFPSALGDGGFDFDAVSHLLHHRSPAARLIARTIVDGIDIRSVRHQFPVLRGLREVARAESNSARPSELSDPRVAAAATAAMALGSVIWGRHLCPALALDSTSGAESAIAGLARWMTTGRGDDDEPC